MNYSSLNAERPVPEILYHTAGALQRESRMFESSYLGTDALGRKLLWPGMYVAINSDTSKYVPYNGAASYGTGSDTPVGIVRGLYDMTLGDLPIAPYYAGLFKKEVCYVFGGEMGVTPAGVQTALNLCKWV